MKRMMFIILTLSTAIFCAEAYDSAHSVCYLLTPDKAFVSDCFRTVHTSEEPASAEMQAMRMCISWALKISANQAVVVDYDRVTFYDDLDQCQDYYQQITEGLTPLKRYNIADLLTWLFQR